MAMDKIIISFPGDNSYGTLNTNTEPNSDKFSDFDFSAGSVNFDTIDGDVVKRSGDIRFNTTSFSGIVDSGNAICEDSYEGVFEDGSHRVIIAGSGYLWDCPGDGAFTVRGSGYTTTQNFDFETFNNRVYGVNGIQSVVYDMTEVYGGVNYGTGPHLKSIGLDDPSSAITVPASGIGGIGDVSAGLHNYKLTYNYYGEPDAESNGSPISNAVSVTTGSQTVNLSNIPTGGYGVTSRNIYRDDNDDNFLLVGSIDDNTTTTFTDVESTGTSPIPTVNEAPPASNGVVNFLSRAWYWDGSTILSCSLVGAPDVIPGGGSQTIQCNSTDGIMACHPFNSVLLVWGRGSMGMITGTDESNFKYEPIPGDVGCVDPRSVQTVIRGGRSFVVWLSAKGPYRYQGGQPEYIGLPIENEINTNIQQVSYSNVTLTHTLESDFTPGTKTGSIVIDGGTITMSNPTKTINDEAEWENGTVLNAVSTNGGSNTLTMPVRFNPPYNEGTLGGSSTLSGSNLTLNARDIFTGETLSSGSGASMPYAINGTGMYERAIPILLEYDGTIGTISFPATRDSLGSGTLVYSITLYNDLLGTPNTVLATTGSVSVSPWTGTQTFSFTANTAVTAGYYWISFICRAGGGQPQPYSTTSTNQWSGSATRNQVYKLIGLTGWTTGTAYCPLGSYTFIQNTQTASGTWTSTTYDTKMFDSSTALTAHVSMSATYPTDEGTVATSTLYVDQSNDGTFGVGTETLSSSNLNGSTDLAFTTTKRYWRVRVSLSTTDDRYNPVLQPITVRYPLTGIWESEVIDHTADITSLVALTAVSTGDVTATIATSDDNVTYSSYTAIGSATPRRYSKIRLTCVTTDGITVPSVSSVTLTWNVQGTFISKVMDPGSAPSGYDVFKAEYDGTVSLSLRSSDSIGGLSGESWTNVTIGEYPTIPVRRYVQWRAIMDGAPNDVPVIDSVSMTFFTSSGTKTARCSSFVRDRNYELSLASVGSGFNDVIYRFNENDQWRKFTGRNASSFFNFFQKDYYIDSENGNIYRLGSTLEESTFTMDHGKIITLDLRTKAFDFKKPDQFKILRDVTINGINTGASFMVYASFDMGTTWITLLDQDGEDTFTSTEDGTPFTQRFVPDVANDVNQGLTVMLRVVSSDEFPVKLQRIVGTIFVRKGKYIPYTEPV